jgi:DNA-binding MarR family transcriptional regulator
MVKKRGFTQLWNDWIQTDLKDIPTKRGILIYLILRSYRNNNPDSPDYGCCTVKMPTLIKDSGYCRDTVSAAIAELKAMGLVETFQGKWEDSKKYRCNKYRVMDSARIV